MIHLPIDIVLKICTYLNFASLVKSERICSAWRDAVVAIIYRNPNIRIKMNVTTEPYYIDARARVIKDMAVYFCLESNKGRFLKTRIVSKNFHPFRLTLIVSHEVDRYIVSRRQGKLQIHAYVHSSERLVIQKNKRPCPRRNRGNCMPNRLGNNVVVCDRRGGNNNVWCGRLPLLFRNPFRSPKRSEAGPGLQGAGSGTRLNLMALGGGAHRKPVHSFRRGTTCFSP